MMLPPHQEGPPSLHGHPGSRDLPILETNPVPRQGAQPMSSSPYSGYPDSARDYTDSRHERPAQTAPSYFSNAPPPHGPYMGSGHPEGQHTSPTLIDRAGGMTTPLETTQKTFLGSEEVPGQGRFFVYEGGIRIPATVDGEQVNPAWGLTKANKPRKRLAQACLDCREKKIKCEIGQASACLQCEKAKRPCRRPPMHPSQGETGTASNWPVSAESPSRKSLSEQVAPRPQDLDHEAAMKRRAREDPMHAEAPNKKHRSTSPSFGPGDMVPTRADSVNYHVSPIAPRSPGRYLSIDEDPYTIDHEGTLRLLESFLASVNDSTYCLLPHTYFVYWVKTSPNKTPDERLVLYAILAVGSKFFEGPLSGMGRQCADIATEALRHRVGHMTMAVAQARLLLSVYYYACGIPGTASEYLGSAISTLTFLKFNTERGCLDFGEREQHDFRFDNAQLAECRRRTMWTAFLLERYMGSLCRISAEDLMIRLPCPDADYEQGRHHSDASYLHFSCIDGRVAAAPPSLMATLITVVAIWGDINTFVSRGQNQSREYYEKTFEKSGVDYMNALRSWQSRLPEHLAISPANIERSMQGRYLGQLMSMHALYYLSMMRLHRFFKHEWLPNLRGHFIPKAHDNAEQLLRMMSSVLRVAWDHNAVEPENHLVSTPPIVGNAVLAAVDILGAGGWDDQMRTTQDLIDAGVKFLAQLTPIWANSRAQHSATQRRYYQIENITKHPIKAKSGCWVGRNWGLDMRLEEEYSFDYDCIYGVKNPDTAYFASLRNSDSATGKGSGKDARSP